MSSRTPGVTPTPGWRPVVWHVASRCTDCATAATARVQSDNQKSTPLSAPCALHGPLYTNKYEDLQMNTVHGEMRTWSDRYLNKLENHTNALAVNLLDSSEGIHRLKWGSVLTVSDLSKGTSKGMVLWPYVPFLWGRIRSPRCHQDRCGSPLLRLGLPPPPPLSKSLWNSRGETGGIGDQMTTFSPIQLTVYNIFYYIHKYIHYTIN
jgi:hypothetical protein